MPDHFPRRPFAGRRAAVASPNHLATAAGVAALARGGSAVDAMVAVNSTLGVVFPHMTGPGGDAFWLVFDAGSGRAEVLNASGRAARAARLEDYAAAGAMPVRGPRAALTVPGAIDGWFQAHHRFGRLPWADCLEFAIGCARDGFPVSPSLARWLAASSELLAQFPATAAVFLKPDGTAHGTGETFRNPRLAATLEAIAGGGRDAFYGGEVGRRAAAALSAMGGVLAAEDLAEHRSDWVEPVAVGYRGRTLLNTPPNSQGFAALEVLGALEHFDVAALAERPADYVDLLVRATQLAFQDRDRYLTDPEFEDVPVGRLLSSEHLAGLAQRLEGGRAAPPAPRPAPALGGDTTFSCAVDGEGNAVGVIQSIYFEWGSGVVAGDTGLLLQNRGSFFSLDPAHPNRLAPGKRTFHTLAAGLALGADGKPELVFGTMGGEGQPQTQVALVTRVLDFGLDVQAAIDAPRWLYGRTWGEEHRGLRLEGRFGPAVAEELAARGHQNVQLVDPLTDLMGHAQAIQVFPERVEAAADPRGDGAAFGF